MSRTLSETVAALNDCEISVEVRGSPDCELTVSVRDPANGVCERKSFLPHHDEKAANWLHGTALRACPDSAYARQTRGLELDDSEGAESASCEMAEGLRQGLTGQG